MPPGNEIALGYLLLPEYPQSQTRTGSCLWDGRWLQRKGTSYQAVGCRHDAGTLRGGLCCREEIAVLGTARASGGLYPLSWASCRCGWMLAPRSSSPLPSVWGASRPWEATTSTTTIATGDSPASCQARPGWTALAHAADPSAPYLSTPGV